MNATATARRPVPQSNWFDSWFDSAHYRALYAHRDDEEATRFIDRLIDRLQPSAGANVLDLGCGTGRHSKCLGSRGFGVTGIDLSAESIRLAKLSETRHVRFFRHDMRLPFGINAFDHVFNLFTSFGYFDDPAEHVTVIHNVATALKPGGSLVLDYLNVRHAEAHLVPEELIERNGAVYRLSRWADDDAIYKRIAVDDGRTIEPLEYVERVARLALEDFRFMCALCDLAIEAVYGDYSLASFDARTSPRLILVARKLAAPCEPSYFRDRFLRMRLTVSGDIPRYEASIDCGTRSAMDG